MSPVCIAHREQKGTTCYAKADTLLEDAEAETAADQTLRRFLDQDGATAE